MMVVSLEVGVEVEVEVGVGVGVQAGSGSKATHRRVPSLGVLRQLRRIVAAEE